jgi:hypothetical protein
MDVFELDFEIKTQKELNRLPAGKHYKKKRFQSLVN